MKVKLIVEGGSMKPGPAVSQQLGPMGINLGKVISDANEATKGFSGIKVPIEISVDTKTKEFTITVFSPPMSELIKKELKIEKGSAQPNKVRAGNLAFESAVGIAKTKLPNLLAKDIRAAVKLVVGSCVSLGILIDSKDPKAVMEEINSGKYDKEIKEEITTVSEEKKKDLEKFYTSLKAKQDKEQKALEEAKAAEEAAKAEAAAAGEQAAAGTEAEKTPEGTPESEPAKTEEPKK